MIVCTECGVRNEDDESFCGECGAYLEWEGERVGAEPEPEPVAEPAPAVAAQPEPSGLFQRVKDAVGIGEHPASMPTDSGALPVEEPVPTAAQAPAPSSAAEPAPQALASPAASAPAAAPLARPTPRATPTPPPPAQAPTSPKPPTSPVADQTAPPTVPSPAPPPATPVEHGPRRQPTQQPPQRPTQQPAQRPGGSAAQQPPAAAAQPAPVAPGVAAVRPGAALPKPRRRELPPEDRAPAPGESICGACGAGNAASRKFCRRCGADLADAPVVAELPWWKRLFRSGPKTEAAAGTRKKHRRQRRFPRFVVPVGILAVLVIAAVATKSQWDPLYQRVLDGVQGTKTTEPNRVSASSAAPGHPATLLRDGATNSFWAPAGNGARAIGQQTAFTFPSPIRLVDVRVFNGSAADLQQYLKQSSPQKVTLTLQRKDGDPVVKTFTLDDKPGGQELGVAQGDVIAVKISIVSVNRPSPARLVAVGEVEFLVRK